MNNLNVNTEQHVSLRIVRTDDITREYIVEYGENVYYRIPQLPFQRNQQQTDRLDCIVEERANGIHLRQDYEKLIRRFYREGDEAVFSIYQTYSEYYILKEEHGFTARLNRYEIPFPALTPKVTCVIKGIHDRFLKIQLVSKLTEMKSGLPLTVKELANAYGTVSWDVNSLAKLLLGSINSDVYESECHKWIVSITADCEKDSLEQTLKEIRRLCLKVLETTDMLSRCNMDQRDLLEKRFTAIIEQADYYLQALHIIKGDSEDFSGISPEEFVERLLSKLMKSGYVYHLRRRFYIMLSLFLQDFSLMDRMMPEIILLLTTSDIRLFRRSPYGQMWTQLLEYYITTCYKDNNRIVADEAMCKRMIQVLLIQRDIAGRDTEGIYDSTLNNSLLCRLSARMNVVDPRPLLEESLYCLTTDEPLLLGFTVKADEPERAANIISGIVSDTINDSILPVRYNFDKASLRIQDGRITLSAKDVTKDNLYLPLSSHMGMWHQLGVELSGRPDSTLRGDKSNTIRHYKELWNFIYKSLFSGKIASRKNERRKLLNDEEVSIIITRQHEDSLVFDCRVVDNEWSDVTGTINAKDEIVPYYPGKLRVSDFYLNGYPLVLTAIVKVNDDGTYSFRMKELVEEYMDYYRVNVLNYNSRLTCMLMKAPHGAKRTPAISKEGLSLSVGVESGVNASILSEQRLVEVYQPERGPVPYINVTYLHDLPKEKFSISQAFHNLMVSFADEEVWHEKDEEQAETFTTMDRTHVLELINTIEDYADTETDNIKRYNYIAFCRVLCRMLNTEKENYFFKRLRLLELINDFAVNNEFTQDDNLLLLSDPAMAVSNDSPLWIPYRQMQIVSSLNSDEHNEELCVESMSNSNDRLRELASLVLSHNFVKKSGLIRQADDILNKIRALLKLPGNESDKKYYGRETYNTEFKTSVAYPENSMHEDLAAQTKKILSEICAFLNADGGTLYLGVNDQGYESGLEEDLKLQRFNGSTDRYEDYLQNIITQKMSQEAAHLVKMHWDEGAKKDVLVIDIEPSADPIMLDGDYYERMGKSARKVNDNYLPVFFENRRRWAEDHHRATRAVAEKKIEELPKSTPVVNDTPVITPSVITDKIQTSRFRNNVLHDYEDDYIPAIGYICFIDQDEYKILKRDDYKTEDYRLELAIHEEDYDSSLILVYADGHVVRVNIQELLDRQADRIFKRYSGRKLIFAGIATDKDYVALGYIDGKYNKRIRFDNVNRLEDMRMQDEGELFTTVSNEGLHYADIVTPEQLPEYAIANPKATDLGIVLKTEKGKELSQRFKIL